mmetsp:Transcript_15261/g.41812  ORF Transcript_15261/g.41812 Transcript_15261/m.41812 type:complete len:223 (+) Transcript_15261:118-786(+)
MMRNAPPVQPQQNLLHRATAVILFVRTGLLWAHLQLSANQVSVLRRLVHEVLMRTFSLLPTSLHHDDPVGVTHGREAMRHHERRTVHHQGIYRLLHEVFRFRIQRRRGLIQQEHAGIVEESTGNGHALLLSARKPDAALTHDCVVTLGEVHDELVCKSGFCRRNYRVLLWRCMGIASARGIRVRNVLSNCNTEEYRLLGHMRHGPSHEPGVETFYVAAVELH